MKVSIKCADCGRPIATMYLEGKEHEIEVHGCYHDQLYHKELKPTPCQPPIEKGLFK